MLGEYDKIDDLAELIITRLQQQKPYFKSLQEICSEAKRMSSGMIQGAC